MDLWSIGGGPSAMGICAFCNMTLIGCSGFAWIYGQLAGGSICHGYMCMLLYMKCVGCSSCAWIYGQLVGGPSAMGICAFCYMWHLWGVMVQHGSLVNWQGSICHGYMCILLYVRLVRCNSVAWIYGKLAGGPSAMGICAFCYIWNLLDVVVLHGSMVNWWGSICHGYMCILLYVTLMGCNGAAWISGQLAGVHLPWVHVHSAICETYEV